MLLGKLIAQASIIALVCFCIYWPALHGEWLMDDNLYIAQNVLIHDPDRLWKTWFVPGSLVEYYPIQASVQWCQWLLWGTDTFGYHLSNVVLHIISSLLVWKLLSKFALRFAWLGGLIFAIHPINVESVAWIAELKNTLSLPPFLLAMCFYIDYQEHKQKRDYWLALGLFLVAMLSKNTVAMFPLIILLYVWWKRGRITGNDLKVSMPFFAVSLVFGIITILAGSWFCQLHHLPISTEPKEDFFSALAIMGQTVSFYFSKFFWPTELLPIYPKWTVDSFELSQWLPWLVLGGMVYFCWRQQSSWGRHILLALGFFIINLLPVIGFILLRDTNIIWSLDHLFYIPIIGLIGLVVAGLGQIKLLSLSFRRLSLGGVAVILLLLVFESRGYAKNFINQEILWTYTLKRNPMAWPAAYLLGEIRLQSGRIVDAIDYYELTLKINPDCARAHYGLGVAFAQVGRTLEAREQYEEALQIDPNYPSAHHNLGIVLIDLGLIQDAEKQFEEAFQQDPTDTAALSNLEHLRGLETSSPASQ